MKNNKKGFTIVELVIVIAVIAILAAVLIPTFSGVVDKANASAALQTAKSTLTNALTMSSTAQLSKGTKIVVDGYAFNYTGNQLESTDYPTEDNTKFSLEYEAEADADATEFNAIIISADSLSNGTKLVSDSGYTADDAVMAVKNDVAKILSIVDEGTLGCLDKDITNVTCVTDGKTAHYYVNVQKTTVSGDAYVDGTDYYTEANGVYTAVDTSQSFNKDAVTIAWDAEIYVNSDLDKDVVVFTTFSNK